MYGDQMEWRATVRIPHYEVSDLGTVRSVDRTVPCRDGRTRRFKGQEIAVQTDPRGYRRVVLYVAAKPVSRTVHSLVAEAFIGSRPRGQEVRHKNGVHGDARAINLEYGTRSQNNRDQLVHGTHVNANKKACKRAHLLVEPNLVLSQLRRGRRECLACARTRAYKQHNPDIDFLTLSTWNYRSIMKRSNR